MKPYYIFIFCFVSITITSVIIVPSLIDDALLPRFITITTFLTLFTCVFFSTISKQLWKQIGLIDMLFLLFFGIHIISICWAQNTAEAIFSTTKIGVFVLLYLFFKWLLFQYKEKAITSIIWSIFCLALLLGIIASYQLYQVHLEVGWDRFTVKPVTGRSGNKNLLSGLLFTCIPLLLLGVFRLKRKINWIYILLAFLLTYLVYQIRTRSVYLAIAVCITMVLLYYAYWYYKYRWLKVMFPILSILLATTCVIFFLGYSQDISEVLSLREGSKTGTIAERFTIWNKSIVLFKENVVIGVGAGNWKIAFPSIGLEDLTRAEQTTTFFARAHNDWIQILCETGIIGGLIWMSIWVTTIWRSSITLGTAILKKQAIPLIIVLSGLLGYGLFTLVSYPLERIEFIIFLSLYFALLSYYTHAPNKTVPFSKLTSKISTFLIILFLGISSIYGVLRMKQESLVLEIPKTQSNTIFTSENYRPTIYSITPTGTPIKYYEGSYHLQKSNYKKAIKAFQEALTVAPNDLPTHLNIGVSYYRSSYIDKALYHYKKALKISPKHQDVLFNTAAVYYKRRDKKKTLEFLRKVQDDYPRKKEFLEAVLKL
ncbi:MAG: O-antigen ligase [Dokdonia sp.]|jgi:O-antigen ligase